MNLRRALVYIILILLEISPWKPGPKTLELKNFYSYQPATLVPGLPSWIAQSLVSTSPAKSSGEEPEVRKQTPQAPGNSGASRWPAIFWVVNPVLRERKKEWKI